MAAPRAAGTRDQPTAPPGGAAEGQRRDLRCLRAVLQRGELFVEVLRRAHALRMPGWYLAAGCVAQTAWNVLGGRAAEAGIRDYDLIYCDPWDLSWDAEDRAIRAARVAFAGLPVDVEVRNQARVHLWYAGRFGVSCPPFGSSEAAIATFPATATCVGVRLDASGGWRVHAPYGAADLLGRVVRPNPVLAPRAVYEAKSQRWARTWPELTVLPWPGEAGTGRTDQ